MAIMSDHVIACSYKNVDNKLKILVEILWLSTILIAEAVIL